MDFSRISLLELHRPTIMSLLTALHSSIFILSIALGMASESLKESNKNIFLHGTFKLIEPLHEKKRSKRVNNYENKIITNKIKVNEDILIRVGKNTSLKNKKYYKTFTKLIRPRGFCFEAKIKTIKVKYKQPWYSLIPWDEDRKILPIQMLRKVKPRSACIHKCTR